jgi:glycosyltransferase involved in cell wall biosynthesis
MMQPPVSVVIPAYNAAGHLHRAIDSVLRQTLQPREVLVVDDGSCDATCQIAAQYCNVQLIRQAHRGAAAARNAGIRASRGEIVAFLDADDEWLPRKLEKQLALHGTPELALSFCRSNEFDVAGKDLGDTFRQAAPRRGPEAWRHLLAANFIATPTVMASRQQLLACGGFDERLKVGEDQDMWIRLALRGPIDFLDESLVRVHMRAESLSSSGFQDQLQFTLRMIERHLDRLEHRRLRPSEARSIRAGRLGQVGRNAYAHGEWRLGVPLIAAAIRAGDRPLHNLYHLAAAPMLGLKKKIQALAAARSALTRMTGDAEARTP